MNIVEGSKQCAPQCWVKNFPLILHWTWSFNWTVRQLIIFLLRTVIFMAAARKIQEKVYEDNEKDLGTAHHSVASRDSILEVAC